MLAALLSSLFILLPMYPMAGFLVFICLMIANIVIYYASIGQKVIEAYLDCFNHLLKMLGAADEMQTVDWPEVKKQMDLTIDKKKVQLKEAIRTLGTHMVPVKLHPKVTAELKVVVKEEA